jgi:hypothetical protein
MLTATSSFVKSGHTLLANASKFSFPSTDYASITIIELFHMGNSPIRPLMQGFTPHLEAM